MKSSHESLVFLICASLGVFTPAHAERAVGTSPNVTVDTRGPEIVVEQPASSSLVDGRARRVFGTVRKGGSGNPKIFTIRNKGAARLNGLTITKSGPNAGDFRLITPERTSLAPGRSAIFIVIFEPTATGARQATIQIRSNDPDESPFDFKIIGFGAAR